MYEIKLLQQRIFHTILKGWTKYNLYYLLTTQVKATKPIKQGKDIVYQKFYLLPIKQNI